MKITKSELRELIREALREELNEGIFDKKLPAGTVVDYKYDAFGHELTVFVQPAKGLHKNADKPLKFEIPECPLEVIERMRKSEADAQKVYDTELRTGKYKIRKTDYYQDGGWLGKKFGESPYR